MTRAGIPDFETRRFSASAGLQVVGDVGGNPTAPSVVLLHGGGQTRHSWGGAMRELVGRGYRVVNLDARGHGDSDWAADGDYSLDALSADLAGVLGTLASPAALVGASMGGATALFLAGAPSSPPVAALVMVDIVPRIVLGGATRIQVFMESHPDGFATLEEAADAVAAYNPHRPRPRDTAGLRKNLRQRPDGRWYWHWDPRLLARADAAEPPRFAERLNRAAERVRIPTLLVRGLQSDLVNDDGVADFKRHLPHLEVCDVAGAGHMVAGDRNDAFNQAVFDFLRRYLPATRSAG